MFLGFLVFLRRGGIKVSLHDWLSLMEGLSMGLHGQSFRGFYVLSRALLVKTESDLDKYEELFCRYFRNVDSDAFKEEISVINEQPELVKNALAGYIQKNKPDAAFVSDRIDELLALYDEENSEIQAFGAGEIMSKANSGRTGCRPGKRKRSDDAGRRRQKYSACAGRQEISGLAYRLHNRVKTVSDSIQAAQGIVTKA